MHLGQSTFTFFAGYQLHLLKLHIYLLFCCIVLYQHFTKGVKGPPKYQNIPTHCNVETINPGQYSRVNIECEHMYRVHGGKVVSVKIPHQQPRRKSVIRKYKAGCPKHGFNWISGHPCPCPRGKMLCNHKIGAGSYQDFCIVFKKVNL